VLTGENEPRMIDLHTHLWRHERGAVLPTYDGLARWCEHAARAGVGQLAITEHCHRFEEVIAVARPRGRRAGRDDLSAAADRVWEQERGAHLDEYVALLTDAQARGLPILVGLEVDHLPGADEPIRDLLAAYPFDVLLGSVHWLGDWLFDAYGDPTFAAEWERRSVDDAWDAYVDAVVDLAEAGHVDVIAHVDVIKVAGLVPADRAAREDRLVAALAAADVVVEVSSAGWRKPVGEPYPSPRLLERLHGAGVSFTTASDAHEASLLGDRFDELYRVLGATGVDTLTTFARRHPRRVAIDSD
jgi:histidinol-phosphatase (PHP family)